MITFTNAKYLKHAGDQMDVKVTIRQVEGQTAIFIRDFEFFSFEDALKCLQRIGTEEMVGSTPEERLDDEAVAS